MEAIVQYRPEIDGLRTMAVVPVILFHAGVEALSGGFVGVDIFFVISGYLITSILMRDLEAGRYSILKFYERRARRILPALVVVTVVSIPFAFWLLPPGQLTQYLQSVFGVATFSSNFVFAWQADYFDSRAVLKPLLHTWSLAVEEQYYILFPPLLALVWRWKPKAVLPMLVIGFVTSLVLAEIVIGVNPSLAFYMLPTRAWELALGGILAVLALDGAGQGGPRIAQAGSALGLAMIVLAVVVIDESDPFPGAIALLPTVGTALVIHFARPGTLACRFLSLRPMVGIGLISYSAYLWHQPLLAFARHYYLLETPDWFMAVMVILTFLLAWLSWRYVEAPFRNRERIALRPVLVFSVSSLAALAMIGLGGSLFAKHLPALAVDRYPRLLAYRYDNRDLQFESWNILKEKTGDTNYGVEKNPADRKLWYDPRDPRRKLLVIGNSHGKDVYNTLVSSEEISRNYQLARFGCQLREAWDSALLSPNYMASDVVVIASLFNDRDLDQLERLSEKILADGKQLVLVKRIFQFPEYRADTLTLSDMLIVRAINSGERDGKLIAEAVDKGYHAILPVLEQPQGRIRANALIDKIASRHRDIIVVDRMDLVCDAKSEKCFAASPTLEKYYFDYGHHTLEGARFFGKRIDETGWLISQLEAQK